MRQETISVARDLFPADPTIAAHVAKAWVDVGVLSQTDTLVANVVVPGAEAARLAAVSPQAVFTVRHGHRYAATIALGGLDQFAGNDDIANKLTRYGFVDVVVTGGGSTRRAEATRNGPDTTARNDSHLCDIAEVAIPAAPSSGVATNASPALALALAGGPSGRKAKEPRKAKKGSALNGDTRPDQPL